MAFLDILKYPDPFLKTMAEPVSEVTDEIRTLIRDMTETMYHARGIGLAATQVGVGKRVVVLDVPDPDDEDRRERGKNLIALINPVIKAEHGTTKYEEGCLSVPGFTADVTRSEVITVETLDLEGRPVDINADGLFAIAIQHEIDHLNGILFIDRLSKLKRDIIKRKIRKALEAEERAL